MKPIDRINRVAGRTYLGGEAGGFSKVAARTISYWVDHGLLIAPSSGPGDRRQFTALQVAEIACIKAMSQMGLSLPKIRGIMSWLRGRRLRVFLSYDFSWIIVPIVSEDSDIRYPRSLKTVSIQGYGHNVDEPLSDSGKEALLNTVMNQDADHTLTVNLGRIADRALAKL